jgi:hypothetical protein
VPHQHNCHTAGCQACDSMRGFFIAREYANRGPPPHPAPPMQQQRVQELCTHTTSHAASAACPRAWRLSAL